jgi:hypothetical protein
MPLLLGQENDETDYNIFKPMGDKTELENSNNIVDYNKFPVGRVNADLKNTLGNVENDRILKENNISDKRLSGLNAQDDSVDDTKIDSIPDPKDPRDLDGDGYVSWGEVVKSGGSNAYENVKSVVSSASTTITSGIEKSVSGAKKVALAIGDVDGDGDIDIHDIGAGFVGAGQNLRSASGLNDLASGVKNSSDQATSQMIYVGGAVILAYILIKY